MSNTYSIYSGLLIFFPIGVIIVLICQLLAYKYGKHKIKDNVSKILLYGTYISAFACTILGYTLHNSKNNPLWCDVYGLPPCFVVYGGTKAFVLGFFLRRARKSNAANTHKLKQLLFDRIGPIYIFMYWVIYATLGAIFFTGTPIKYNENHSNNDIISYCKFDTWSWWFIVFSNTVDLFNCIATVLLFLYPLIKSISRLRKNDNVNNKLLLKFINLLKWNVILSFVACITSLLTLSLMPVIEGYIWILCTGDPFINSLCVFAMMASNRKFISRQICGYFPNIHKGQTNDITMTTPDFATSPDTNIIELPRVKSTSCTDNNDKIITVIMENKLQSNKTDLPLLRSSEHGYSIPIKSKNIKSTTLSLKRIHSF